MSPAGGTRADGRRPARIALFINSLQRGGAETQFLRAAQGLRRAGYDVRIFTILPANDFTDELDGLPVTLLAPRPGPRTLGRAVRELRGWRADVTIGFLYQAGVLARLAARAAGVPVIVSSMRNERLETRARTLVFRLTGRLDSATVTNSPAVARVLEAEGTVRPGTTRVIPNALDLDRFDRPVTPTLRTELGVDGDTVLFLGIGRLVPQKDWPTLVAAAAAYRGPPAHWAIAGDGAGHADLAAAIDAAGLADRITLLGPRSDAPALLAACDALVLSSIYEGLPNVVLEAMAAARPVVATRVGACAELVGPDTGVLVAPGRPGELADAMAELARRSASERAAMGRHARVRVQRRFALPAVQEQWVALVDELLAGAKSRRSSPSILRVRNWTIGSSGRDAA